MNKSDKDEYLRAVQTEMMRSLMLSREDLHLKKEEDAEVYAVWFLLNPLSVPKRRKLETYCLRRSVRNRRICRLTFHAHRHEPLEPSPDDVLIYDSRHRFGERSLHFIADRFILRRFL